MARWMLWSSAVVIMLAGASHAQNGVYSIQVTRPAGDAQPAATPGFYLSPELQAAQRTAAEVVGMDAQGQVLLRTNEPGRLLELNWVKTANKVDLANEKVESIRLLIGFREGQQESVTAALKKAGFQVVKTSARGKYVLVEGEKELKGAISPRMINALSKDVSASGATSAAPNFKLTVPEPKQPQRLRNGAGAAATRPNDEFFNSQWGLENINAPRAWGSVTGSPVIVAVIDTGIQHEHPDLRENIWTNAAEANGTTGVDDDNNGFVDDVHGWDFFADDASVFDDPLNDDHGTHVAGTIGAMTNNTTGVAGVNWRVQIMPVKFLGPGGGSLDDAVDSILYAIDNGANILNNSWGGGGFDPVLENAIREADAAGVLFVAAAGNGGFDGIGDDNDLFPSYPSSYDVPNVIAVAAVDEPSGAGQEELTVFSNFGATSVDLAAPGADILSTIPDNTYAFFSGTSMATPHVSGALALMRGTNDLLHADHLQLKQRLFDEARPANALSGRCVTGATLDVGFLGSMENPDKSLVVLASKTFGPGSAVLTGSGGTIAEVEIELSANAEVLVVANTSGSSSSSDVLMDMRLFSDSAAGPWENAFRFADLPQAEKWTGLTMNHGTQLPAGKHVIRWFAFLDGGDVMLDGGSLTVLATLKSSANSTVRTADLSEKPAKAAPARSSLEERRTRLRAMSVNPTAEAATVGAFSSRSRIEVGKRGLKAMPQIQQNSQPRK